MTLLTEDEAKTKWCPMVRDNGSNLNGESSRCIGSACMAWRWKHELVVHGESLRGYCGAFGKIEP